MFLNGHTYLKIAQDHLEVGENWANVYKFKANVYQQVHIGYIPNMNGSIACITYYTNVLQQLPVEILILLFVKDIALAPNMFLKNVQYPY